MRVVQHLAGMSTFPARPGLHGIRLKTPVAHGQQRARPECCVADFALARFIHVLIMRKRAGYRICQTRPRNPITGSNP